MLESNHNSLHYYLFLKLLFSSRLTQTVSVIASCFMKVLQSQFKASLDFRVDADDYPRFPAALNKSHLLRPPLPSGDESSIYLFVLDKKRQSQI